MTTILVVDDEPDLEALILQRFRRQIREDGMAFLFARDGVEALDLVARHPGIDLALADINMPRMDGLTLLGRLQEADDPLATVIVSAYGDMRNIRTAMNRGAFDFLTKPIDFADLEATVAKTVRHVAGLRDARARRAAAERAHAALARYFSPNLAAELAAETRALSLASQRRDVTAVFTDITDFTAVVETLEPAVLADLLNGYFAGHDGHRLRPWRHDHQDHGRRAPGAFRRARRPAGPRGARGRVRARPRRLRGGVPRPAEGRGHPARQDAHRPAFRPRPGRRLRGRAVLRLHGLREHHQHRRAARGREQGARHAHLRQRRRGRAGPGFQGPPCRRPASAGHQRVAARL